MTDTLWELSNVCLGRDRCRLLDVSLTIPHGVTAVIGPSGAGKTSLLNLLVGFEAPDEGRIEITLDRGDHRLPLGWVPPDFGLWPHLSVREHLETMLSHPDPKAAHPVADLLDDFGLIEQSDANVGRLSQGERSRLAVARALAGDPNVLVLDEPLVHVDPIHLDEYWRIIRNHCQSRKTSLVFSAHAPEVVLREAQQVICLDNGRAVFHGDVPSLYRHPPSERLATFLGPANWFAPQDARRWLNDHPPTTTDVCLRPSQLEVIESPGSGLIVQSSVSAPSLTISEIQDEQSRKLRTLYHQHPQTTFASGTHILLRICALLLLGLGLSSCQQSAADPQITVDSTRTLKMPAEGASIPAPRSMTVSQSGELYVLDNAGRVLVYDHTGTLNRQWWMPEYDVGKPEGICILDDGRVAVADTHYHRVVCFDPQGTVLSMFGELGESPGQFIYPVSITPDDDGNLYVAEYGGNDRLQKFSPAGEHLLTIGSLGTDVGQFQRPSGVVWRRNEANGSNSISPPATSSNRRTSVHGTLYVADAINNRVQAFSDDGQFLGIIAGWTGSHIEREDTTVESDTPSPDRSTFNPRLPLLDYPYDIALGPDQTLYVVEYGAGRVTWIHQNGTLLGRYGVSGRGDGEFWTPWGIAAGYDRRLFIADTGNKRIVELAL